MSDTYTGDLNVEPSCTVTCDSDDCPNTLGITTGCDLLKYYDNLVDGDGHIDIREVVCCGADLGTKITQEELDFVCACHGKAINDLCPGCYCSCTPWANAECTAVGKRRQTRVCTPAGCDTESRIIDDATCKPNGDITKVTLDDKLLPEGGTLDWILDDDAHVKVFFKNIGNVASTFHIWLTNDTGVPVGTGPTIIGCDITTSSIAADNTEYYVDLCVFLPDIVEVKTLTAHIDP